MLSNIDAKCVPRKRDIERFAQDRKTLCCYYDRYPGRNKVTWCAVDVFYFGDYAANTFRHRSFSPTEIEKVQKGEIPKKEQEKETYLDLFATKNLKLKERVLIPTKQYPRVGRCSLLLFQSYALWLLPPCLQFTRYNQMKRVWLMS